MKKQPLRVGLIGYGMIGKVHAFGYATLPFYAPALAHAAKITHVVTAHSETAKVAAESIGCDSYSTDHRDITANPEIDIVHICSPNVDHLPQLLTAIKHNKHIYCDKPLGVDATEAQAVVAALDAKDNRNRLLYTATSQMTFHLRFFTAIERAKQILDAGKLGRLLQYRVAYLHSSNASPYIPFKWKHGAGGGVILDLVSHLADLIDYLIGLPDHLTAQRSIAYERRPAKAVTPITSSVPLPWHRGVPSMGEMIRVVADDSVAILTSHQQRTGPPITGIMEATKLATGYEDELRLEIHGEDGAIRFSLMNPHYLEFFDAKAPDSPTGGTSGWTRIACGARYSGVHSTFPSPKSTTGWVRAHTAALATFLTAVVEGRPSSPDLRQGCRIQEFLEKVKN